MPSLAAEIRPLTDFSNLPHNDANKRIRGVFIDL